MSIDVLQAKIRKLKNPSAVGLDPQLAYIPRFIQEEAFSAYGAETYVDMIGTNEAPGAWYPMWSYSNSFTTDTEGGMAWNKIGEIKHEYLPQVVMAKDFDAAWAEYMDAYNSCDPGAFIGELQTELDKRMEEAAKYE